MIEREEAETYWQPAPSHGTMNTILSPRNCPSNAFSVATQYIDPGCMIRPHAHERAEEILYLYEGHGTLTLEGRRIPVREGSTCLVGRYVRHQLDNESAGTMKVTLLRRLGIECTLGTAEPAPFHPPEEAEAAYRRSAVRRAPDLA